MSTHQTATPQGSSLHIGKLRNRFVSPHALDEAQVRQWQEAFCEQDPADLVGRVVADDEWLLIRKLPLKLRWRPESPATEVGRTWMQGLQQAVEQVVDMAADGTDEHNVLRYRLWRHGLADLLYRSALGETQRQWAWQRMGLLTRDGLAANEALLQGAQTLLQHPDLIWPVLHHCLHAEPDTGAFTALARRLPAPMWRQWWSAAPQTRMWMQALQGSTRTGQALQASSAEGEHAANKALRMGTPAPHAAHEAVPAHSEALNTLLAWAHRYPQWARMLGDGLTVWFAALAWPSQAHVFDAGSRLQAAQSWWLPDTTKTGATGAASATSTASAANALTQRASARDPSSASDAQGQAHQAVPVPDKSPSQQAPLTHTDEGAASTAQLHRPSALDDLPTAPELPDAHTTQPTAWAGALFWLRHLSVPGVITRLHAESALDLDEAAATPQLMQAVAMALHVPIDDPVMSVMTAGQPLQAVPPSLQRAAASLVAEWSQWLDAEVPDAPAPRMAWVCQRPGRLKAEPGWIEVHLDMDQIDTRIRRIGLDLDPDWVPLIGAVVKIRYEGPL